MAEFARLLLVEIAQRIERLAAKLAVHPGRIAHVQNGVTFGPALHALENRRNEARAPQPLPAARLHAAADEHDEAGQIFIL